MNHMKNKVTNPQMRLYLDSAEPHQWQRYMQMGIFYGVTTNPLLLERSNQACTLPNLELLVKQAVTHGVQEMQVQTWGESIEEMVTIGHQVSELSELGLDIVVKIPITEDGLIVAKRLKASGTEITLTAVYSPGQVLAAASMGATYAAPYLGRLDDAGRDGIGILDTMHKILQGSASSTRLLVASIRSIDQLIELAQRGFNTFTFGPSIAEALIVEDLTIAAALDFQRAARKMNTM